MSKKNKKQAKQEPSKQAEKPGLKSKSASVQTPKGLTRLSCIILAAIAFLLYSNTLNHLYVLDDFSIIKDNPMTKKGTDALGDIFSHSYRYGFGSDDGGIYRPLSKAMFAIEWEIAPDDPGFSHLVGVICYAITAALLFITLNKFLKVNVAIPFVITLLYIAHPIHTEVVANIKSRDEILSLLFILLSLLGIHRHIEKKDTLSLILSFVAFFLALLSKESSITYLAVVPVTIWFFTNAPRRLNMIISFGMIGTTMIYLILHYNIIGNIGITNIPVVDNSLLATEDLGKQKATAILIMGHYMKLLLFPHPLSCDYSFNTIPIVESLGDPMFLLAFLIHAALAVYAFMKWKTRSVLVWCIIFYFVTMSLASNLLYLIGTNMAERLLYIPSLAFSVATGWLLAKVMKINMNASYGSFSGMITANGSLLGVAMIFFIPYAYKTYDRNNDWETVKTLFDQDVQTVPNSSHMLFYHANMQTNTDSLKKLTPDVRLETLKRALEELNAALKIYEQFPDAHNQVGKIYFELKNYELATKAYERALELNPKNATYQNNYGTCLFANGKYAEAEKFFVKAIELDKEYNDALCNLGSVYGTLGEINFKQGKAAEANALFEKAIYYFKETARVDPEYENAYIFLVATYKNLGREKEGQPYQTLLNQVQQKKKQKK